MEINIDEKESGATVMVATEFDSIKYFTCCCNLAHDSKSCFGQKKEEETNDEKIWRIRTDITKDGKV